MRILHIAPFNTAGVPLTFVQAERALGHDSRLITLGRNPRGHGEDICLDLPLLDFWATRWAKKMVTPKHRRVVTHRAPMPLHIPKEWRPGNGGEAALVKMREAIWKPRVERAITEYRLNEFDAYQLDGGLGFFRDGRFVHQMKARGKTVICCYTGSDLRTRGVIPEIDALSQANFTVEFDHLRLHPNIHHVPFPFDVASMSERRPSPGRELPLIGHAPTHRQAKGSAVIIPVLRRLEREGQARVSLIENLPHREALKRKAECTIFVDQIGDLGFGINSLESLALGIATCSCLVEGYAEQYPDHPFVPIDGENLYHQLSELIEDPTLRASLAERSRAWVAAHHDPAAVVRRIHKIAYGPDV